MSHFRFLACVCKNMIGFNMNPQQKELACIIIKDYFPNKPTILGVGDGYNDALMMQASHISIEIINSKLNHIYPQVNAGDISVNTLKEIKVLLLQKCKLHSERISSMIIYLFYCSGFLGMTLFFFNWFCQFTATSLHDSMTVFLFIFLYVTPNALVIGLADLQTMPQVNSQIPTLYVDGQIRTRRFGFYYLIESFLESFLSAAFTFYTCISDLIQNIYNSEVNKYKKKRYQSYMQQKYLFKRNGRIKQKQCIKLVIHIWQTMLGQMMDIRVIYKWQQQALFMQQLQFHAQKYYLDQFNIMYIQQQLYLYQLLDCWLVLYLQIIEENLVNSIIKS